MGVRRKMNTVSTFVINTLTSLIYPFSKITGLHLDNIIMQKSNERRKAYGSSHTTESAVR